MFIFYYAVLSEVSPPTALSPFAAAAITGGDPYRTTLQSWKYTLPAFLVPFMFVLDPAGSGLLLKGSFKKLGRRLGLDRASRSPRWSASPRSRRACRAGCFRQDQPLERWHADRRGAAAGLSRALFDYIGIALVALVVHRRCAAVQQSSRPSRERAARDPTRPSSRRRSRCSAFAPSAKRVTDIEYLPRGRRDARSRRLRSPSEVCRQLERISKIPSSSSICRSNTTAPRSRCRVWKADPRDSLRHGCPICDVARAIGPRRARSAARAARIVIPLVIPCHRVVGSGRHRRLHAHARGGAAIDVKRWLLHHENRRATDVGGTRRCSTSSATRCGSKTGCRAIRSKATAATCAVRSWLLAAARQDPARRRSAPTCWPISRTSFSAMHKRALRPRACCRA